jgi:hypothetical protein
MIPHTGRRGAQDDELDEEGTNRFSHGANNTQMRGDHDQQRRIEPSIAMEVDRLGEEGYAGCGTFPAMLGSIFLARCEPGQSHPVCTDAVPLRRLTHQPSASASARSARHFHRRRC